MAHGYAQTGEEMVNSNQKQRIVLLTDCLADLAGGAEKQIYELAKRLDKERYDVFVVSLETWGVAPRAVIESTGSVFLAFKVKRIYGLSGLIQGFRFKRFLKSNKIDVLITYHFSSDMWGTFWGHFGGVKKIFSNRRDMGFWRNFLHVGSYKLLNRWVSKVIVVSNSIKEMVVKKEGLPADLVKVIYNGVEIPPIDQQARDNERARLGLRPEELAIMHVANLKPIKGHQYLLQALAEVVPQYPHVRLFLAGKDECNGQIRQLARELGINANVTFLGKQDNVATLLLAADICVLPSLSEGMSNSILEYMAAAKPVIATNVGGNPELIKENVNGLLVNAKDAADLKSALIKLITNPTMRAEMGYMGYQSAVEEFSMQAMISRYESLINDLRVLHLISSGGMFGAERVILHLASKCQAISFVGALHNKHNPHLEIIDEARKMGLNHIVFDSKGPLDLSTPSRISAFMKQQRIDILHTHNYKADIVGAMAVRTAKVKWVATNHVWHSTDNKLKFYEGLDALILKYAGRVIGVSSEIVDDLIKKGFNPKKLQCIDNGIPVEQFGDRQQREAIRHEWGIPSESLVFMIVGRLAPEKGHEVFLNAAAMLVGEGLQCRFVIVGDGPLVEQLRQQVASLNLVNHVIFAGIRKDMADVYTAADVLVNASFIEGLPMTILESMASGLPVIATDVGAVGKVIINAHNGILLKAGDVQALVKAMRQMAHDTAMRTTYAQKAKEDVKVRFSDEIMAQKYMQIYEGL